MKAHIAALGVLLLPSGLASAQEPPPKPRKQEPGMEVATLGATTRAPSRAEVEELGLKFEVRVRGQVVTNVAKGGAAANAGIKAGDALVKLGKTELYSQDDIADFLRVSKPRQKVEAVLVRASTLKEETVAVTLGVKQVKAPEKPELEWEFASLSQLDDALAAAKQERKLVLVGLSGAET